MIIPQIFIGCICVGFLSSTFTHYQECLPKMYTRRFSDDGQFIVNDLLEEIPVNIRAECFPICDSKKDCNLVLYNNMTGVCRLYDYRHYNTTMVHSTGIGWQSYGVECSQFNCVIGPVPSPNRCSSCLYGNVWTVDGPCILYQGLKRIHTDYAPTEMQLPFGLMPGMSLMVDVLKNEPGSLTFLTLKNSPLRNYIIGTDIFTDDEIVSTYTDTVSSSVFGGTFPVLNTMHFSVTTHIDSGTLQIFIDGTLVKTFPTPPAPLDVLSMEGVGYYRVYVVRLPTYCR